MLTFWQRVKKLFLAREGQLYEFMFWVLILGVTGMIHERTAYICIGLFAGIRFALLVAWKIFVYELENWEGGNPFAEEK